MRLLDLSKYRILVQFVAACLFCMLIYLWTFRYSEPSLRNHRKPETCQLVMVKGDGTSCPRSTIASLEAHPCFWSIEVVGDAKPESHALLIDESEFLRPQEVSLLRRLDGCNSTSECDNEVVPCTYGIEDPSDALWLREYHNSTKFVVIFRVGLASLIFFIAAIISDGSIFEPHRSGLSSSSASLLFLIAISSLLYLLLIPPSLQLSLYGAGPLQSIGFVFLVTSIACMLPGLVVIWINVAVFFVFFLGFLLEQLVYIFIGIMHFLGVLSLYQAENTLLHLRIIYTRDVLEQAEFDRRLVSMSQRFLSRIRHNWHLQRLPRAMEEDAMQIVSNVLPEHLYDEVMHEGIPQVEFEDLDREEAGAQTESRQAGDVDEGTPLLQANGRIAVT